MPLRDFSYTKGNAAELIRSHISEEFPLAFEDFVLLLRNNQILFLFDGFDEIKGELTQTAINERAAGKIFARPSLLSCRKSFFDFYLSMSILQEYYPIWIELRPLEMDTHVEQYIATFCSQKQSKLAQNISPIEPIIQTIKGTPELQDLAQRPLLLIMMLDIFTDPKEVNEEIWNVAILYKKYTELWLKNEAAKLSSILKWNEKAGLLEEIAWITYSSQPPVAFLYSLNQSVTFTYIDIAAIIKNAASRYLSVTEAQILDDLCFRTLLLLSEGETYYFLHKSFQEYYAARYIFNCMRSREKYTNVVEKIEEVLQVLLPFDIGTFLKQILEGKDVTSIDKEHLTDNLMKVYQHQNGNDLQSATVRQQSSHYLAYLRTSRAVQFLSDVYEQESDKWVQRGIMVGLALYCGKASVLEKYIRMIREDDEVASINIGYHLVYYGDQPLELGYYDRGGERCDRTIAALFRHLKREHYKNGWALDILTLSTLLESRGTAILTSKSWQSTFLKEYLSRTYIEQGSVFLQEIHRLRELLEGIAGWK